MEALTRKKRAAIPKKGDTQQCFVCEDYKPFDQFYVDGRGRPTGRCKSCRKLSSEEKRDANLRANYDGFTLVQYREMFEEQKGVCASCGRPETNKHRDKLMPLSVDHCHTTGAIRGLLCHDCNVSLGLLGENPDRVEALLRYIHERVLY